VPEAVLDAASAGREGRALKVFKGEVAESILFMSTRRKPRRYLIVAARRLPAAVICHRYLIVVPRPLPAALPVEDRR